MRGQIVQVNVSAGGVPKRPIPQVFIAPLGLEGDGHAHPNIHGGPKKAVLVVSAEAVDALIANGFPLFYGALGENLTVRGIESRWLRSGQRWRAGQAIVELTTLKQMAAGPHPAQRDLGRQPPGRQHLVAALGAGRFLCVGDATRRGPAGRSFRAARTGGLNPSRRYNELEDYVV